MAEVFSMSVGLKETGAAIVRSAIDKLKASMKDAEKETRKTDRAVSDIGDRFRTLAASIASVAGAGATLRAIDAFQTMNNQIRLATKTTEEFSAAQSDVVRIAQQTFQPVESVSDLYAKAARSAAALGLSQAQVAKLTQTVSQALLINGTGAGAAAGALQQFGQALANGKVMAEEFNSILDGMAPLIQGIEKDMGLVPGSLKRMVVEGKVSSEQFAQMILQNKSVSETFANYIPTISQNMVGLRNQFVLLSGKVAETTGFTRALNSGIAWLSANLPTLIALLGAGGLVFGIVKLAQALRTLTLSVLALKSVSLGLPTVVATLATLAAAYVGFEIVQSKLAQTMGELNAQQQKQVMLTHYLSRANATVHGVIQSVGKVVLDLGKKGQTYIEMLVELAGLVPITTADHAKLTSEVARLRTAMEVGNLPMAKRLELAKQLSQAEKALEGATVRRSLAEAQAAMAAGTVGGIGRTPSGGPNIKDSMARARENVRASAQEIGALIDTEFRDNVLATAQGLGDQLRDTLGASVASAFEVLATRGATVGDAFGALGAAMLRGLGDMTIAFGISVMKIGKLMTGAVAALKNLNGPAAVAAGLAIVAVGGLMRGAAGRAFGGVGGGSTPIVAGGGLGGMAGPSTLPGLTFGPTMASSASSVSAMAPVAVTIIGPNDPQAQRQMQELIRNANRRGNIMGA